VVTPETVVRWHRAGFRLYWSLISRVRRRVGRKKLSKEVRHLIFRMVAENPTWGAPRIHGELLMLGFDVSERTISRWMKRASKDPEPARSWLTFLHNHREAIAAMDFFTVPTITFGVLYCFFIIGHDRRRILHFNVTRHPTGAWIVQQLREAFPYERATEFLLLDHDSKYGTAVPVAIRSMDIKAVRTAVGCLAERGSRALGRQLPSRTAGSRDCHQRVASEAAPLLLCRVLPPGSDPLRTAEADSGKANALLRPREAGGVASCRRPSSSLRTRCLNC
jgi:hypothetical protein